MAWDACGADLILLPLGGDRLAVFRGNAPGLEKAKLVTTDATRCTSELVLDKVQPEAILPDASHAISKMLDAGRIALAADSLGACEAMIEQAVDYAKQRKQFDRLIGSFQAVKHMCAEMISELEPLIKPMMPIIDTATTRTPKTLWRWDRNVVVLCQNW